MRGELKFLKGRPDLIEQARDILIEKFKNHEKIKKAREYNVYFENGPMLPFKEVCRAAAQAANVDFNEDLFTSSEDHRNDFEREFGDRFKIIRRIECDHLAFRHSQYIRIRNELLPQEMIDNPDLLVAYKLIDENHVEVYSEKVYGENGDLQFKNFYFDNGNGKNQKGYYLISLRQKDKAVPCKEVFLTFKGFDMENEGVNYWHIQLHPNDKKSFNDDKIREILNKKAVIGCGEWTAGADTIKDFKNRMSLDDIVVVKNGHTPIALVKVSSPSIETERLNEDLDWFEHRRNVEVLDFYKEEYGFEIPQPRGTLSICDDPNARTTKIIKGWHQMFLNRISMKKEIELLKYKKQIILQGPPGTGKTYLAKKMAQEIVNIKIGAEQKPKMQELLAANNEYFTQEGNPFFLEKIVKETCYLRIGNNNDYQVTFDNIISVFNKVDSKIEGKSYAVGLANYLKEHLNEGRVKLIQFHPSYSYDDFVRGIKVSAEGEALIYEATNRVFGQMAHDAYKNAIGNELVPEKGDTLSKIYDAIESFKEYIDNEAADENCVHITKAAKLIRTSEDYIAYKGDNWPREGRIPVKDLAMMYMQKVSSRKDVKALDGLAKTAKSESTYWLNLCEKFTDFVNKKNIVLEQPTFKKQVKQHYVLIIDEINRANLPSVLGELIYGLEYRNRPVESMYEVDEKRDIIIPDNLLIIGTMNTADRSVGHIDYAIRRRFAFVDVLPEETIIKTNKGKELFRKVAELFVTNKGARSTHIGADFDWKDVQIGHSYFMGKEEELPMRWKYEIKPILEEYIKDGVLIETANKELANLENEFGYK